MLEIVLYFVFCTYWLMYGLPDDDDDDDDDERSKYVEGVIVKLYVDIMHLVGYNMIVYICIL